MKKIKNRSIHFLAWVMVMAVLVTGCGYEDLYVAPPTQEFFTEPAAPDFGEKPGEQVGYVHSHPNGSTVRYDLNGDGRGENITFHASENDAGVLTIGNASVEIWSDSPTGYFTVLNVDDSVNRLLVGISEYGPSDDFQTDFYAYDGIEIIEVGHIYDIIGENIWDYDGAVCHGDGTITAGRRWNVLGSWNTVALYRVNGNSLEDITDFYPYIDWDGNVSSWEVKARVDIITYGSDWEMGSIITIPGGTTMRMTGLCRIFDESSFWVAFEVDGLGTRWLTADILEWESYVHTGIGFVSSEEAFEGFFYAG